MGRDRYGKDNTKTVSDLDQVGTIYRPKDPLGKVGNTLEIFND
jgi:hypothetical protein